MNPFRHFMIFCLAAQLMWPACQPNTQQPALTDEKMARIMADIFVAEAATNGLSGYEKDSLSQVYFAQVFEIHGVTKADYQKSLEIASRDEMHIERVVKQAVDLLKPAD